MFVGHTALALAAKRRSPEISLGWLVAAAYGLDLIWPVLLLLGVEQVTFGSATGGFDQLTFISYPWSHSLLTSILWGAIVFGFARWRGVSPLSSLVLGGLVASHWVLDYASHAPDMPLWPGESPHVGLGLWSSIPLTFAVEGGLFLAGILLYVSATKARDRIGSIGLWALLVTQTAMWASSPWGQAPPSIAVLGWVGLIAQWAFIAWAWWADEHRVVG